MKSKSKTSSPSLVASEYKGIILQGNKDIFPLPYSPLFVQNNGYNLFVNNGGVMQLAYSENLIDWIYKDLINCPYGNVIPFGNQYLAFSHKWYNVVGRQLVFQRMHLCNPTISERKFKALEPWTTPTGEDITILYEDGYYKCYIRPRIPAEGKRTIGYMESTNGLQWSTIIEVLVPDTRDDNDEFYSMSVVSTPRGWFGFLNVYDPSPDNDSVRVQLVHSANGKTDWVRKNDRNEILIRRSGVKQLYACASLIEDEVFIACISAKFRHDGTDRNGRFFNTELYKINVNDLYNYL